VSYIGLDRLTFRFWLLGLAQAGAIWFRSCVPGLATAPLLFVAGILVLRELFR
jgi:hypothetical protein